MSLFKYIKENFFNVIMLSLFFITVCQLVPTYTYSEIEHKLNRFKKNQIENKKITDKEFLFYKPSKYKEYIEIKLENDERYPILVEDEKNISLIKIGSIINKENNSSKFTIDKSFDFKIKDLSKEKFNQRIFMLVISIIGIFVVLLENKKK